MSKLWTPRPYQISATCFLLNRAHAGLFLDPGLGKTSIALNVMRILKYNLATKGSLIIAPLKVAENVWPRELEKWRNFKILNCTILHGKNKKSALWGDKKDIYVINPEGLEWLHDELLDGLSGDKTCPFDCLWVDESTKFKSNVAQRFKLIRNLLPLFKRRHILTGTPSPKSFLDLWSQLFIVDEGETLGKNFYKFRRTYFEKSPWDTYTWKIKENAEDKMYQVISNVVLNMTASNYISLPKLTFNELTVTLPKKAMGLYNDMEYRFFMELDKKEVSAKAANLARMKCHQIANGNVYENVPESLNKEQAKLFLRDRKAIHVHDEKIKTLMNLIEELNGKSLLVAYYYKHDLDALKSALGASTPHIGGNVSAEKTAQIINAWNMGDIPVLLGHPASMAHGLNLQDGGHDICWFSLTWNLEEYLQFNARIYRSGVEGSVRVHHLVASATVDELMLMRLRDRAKNQASLRQAIEAYRRNKAQISAE